MSHVGFKPNPEGQCYRTPPEIFKRLHDIFNFTVDAAADAGNALLPRFWTDALNEDWSPERVFCNPPFAQAKQFLKKAATADRALMILPLNCLTAKYYHDVGGADFVCIPQGRINFVNKSGQHTSRMMLGTCFLIWGPLSDGEQERLGGLIYQKVISP